MHFIDFLRAECYIYGGRWHYYHLIDMITRILNEKAKENEYLNKYSGWHQETCCLCHQDTRSQGSCTRPARKMSTSKQDKRKNNIIIRFKYKVHLKVKLN